MKIRACNRLKGAIVEITQAAILALREFGCVDDAPLLDLKRGGSYSRRSRCRSPAVFGSGSEGMP